MDYSFLNNIQTKYHKLNLHYNSNPSSIPSEQIIPRDSIKLLTYNLFQVPLTAGFIHPAPHGPARLRALTSFFDDFDIMCFQECWGFTQSRRNWLIQAAQKAGFFFWKESPMPSLFSWYFGDGGLLIMSRFEIVDWEFMPFSYGVFLDAMTQRGTLYVKVKLHNADDSLSPQFLNVFNLHTNSSTAFPFPKVMRQTVTCRQDQVKEMCEMVDFKIKQQMASKQENSYLVVGDFNISGRPFPDRIRNMVAQYKPEYADLVDVFEQEYQQLIDKISYGVPNYGAVNIGFEQHGENLPSMSGAGPIDRRKRMASGGSEPINLSLDYIFEKRPKDEEAINGANRMQTKLKVRDGSCKLEKFEVGDPWPVVQLSDHFGLSVELALVH